MRAIRASSEWAQRAAHLRSCLPEVLWTCAQGNPLPSGRPAAAQRASELCMHALRKTETTASDKSVRGSGGIGRTTATEPERMADGPC